MAGTKISKSVQTKQKHGEHKLMIMTKTKSGNKLPHTRNKIGKVHVRFL